MDRHPKDAQGSADKSPNLRFRSAIVVTFVKREPRMQYVGKSDFLRTNSHEKTALHY